MRGRGPNASLLYSLQRIAITDKIGRASSADQWSPSDYERLNAATEFRLTLLVAPARSGKTSLLKRWAREQRRPCAWVTLIPEDNEPARFLSDLLAALRAISLPLADLKRDAFVGNDLAEGLVDVINAVADCPDDWVLVLDNYHVIGAEEIHAGMRFLLDYPPPRLHIVIANCSEPPLQLPRLRVRRQLVQIGLGDLAQRPMCEDP